MASADSLLVVPTLGGKYPVTGLSPVRTAPYPAHKSTMTLLGGFLDFGETVFLQRDRVVIGHAVNSDECRTI